VCLVEILPFGQNDNGLSLHVSDDALVVSPWLLQDKSAKMEGHAFHLCALCDMILRCSYRMLIGMNSR
jgi:hypothetical protein